MSATQNRLPPPPTPLICILRGFALRCPRCGVGPMSAGLFRRTEGCPACKQSFALNEGEFTGGAYMGYGLSVMLLLAVFVVLVWGFGWELDRTLWVMVPGGIVVPVLIHRHTVGAFTGILIASGAMEKALP